MLGIGTKNLGIDLGTANTIVYLEGKGIVLREPSVVARNSKTNEVIAVGSDARDMIGRTPESIVAIRPMKDGVIADYDTTVAMMKYYIDKALGNNGKPYVMVCVPSGITEVEKRAVIDATRVAGARDAYVVEEPFAAAIGAGLPVRDPPGSRVVDIGGGTTDVATISLGGIVSSRSIRMAGDKMNDAIVQYVRQHMNLLIGERTAEKLKWDIGSASVEAAEEMYYLTADGKKVDNKTVYLENQLYSSKENGKWGFVDLKDNVIVDYQYDEITEINQYGFAGIKKDGKWGVINKDGEVILEPTYESNSINPVFIGKYCLKNGVVRDYI